MNERSRSLVVAVVILLVIALISPIVGWAMMGWGMVGPRMMWGGGQFQAPIWMMILGMISMIAFWIAVILGIVLLVRSVSAGQRTSQGTTESANEILQRRYAAGEITHEEYERMRQELAT